MVGNWVLQKTHGPICRGSPWSTLGPRLCPGQARGQGWCWHRPRPRGRPEPHPGLCPAPLHAEQAAILPCVTTWRGGRRDGCAGSERPGDRVQPGHRAGAREAARRQPPAPPAHLCHLPRPQGSEREGQCGRRARGWFPSQEGKGNSRSQQLCRLSAGFVPSWVVWQWGQECSGGVMRPSHPTVMAVPDPAGWDGAGGADVVPMSLVLAPGNADGWPTPSPCWDHPGEGCNA